MDDRHEHDVRIKRGVRHVSADHVQTISKGTDHQCEVYADQNTVQGWLMPVKTSRGNESKP